MRAVGDTTSGNRVMLDGQPAGLSFDLSQLRPLGPGGYSSDCLLLCQLTLSLAVTRSDGRVTKRNGTLALDNAGECSVPVLDWLFAAW